MSSNKKNSNRTNDHKLKQQFDFDNVYVLEKENAEDQTDAVDKSHAINVLDENVLSQKLSQLSCSQPHQQQNVKQSNKIPNYLSNKNKSFQKLIKEILSTMITSRTTVSSVPSQNEQDLRDMAILIHRIKSEQIFQSLWMTYLKSGTGQLKVDPIGPSVWPLQVRTIVKQANKTGSNENVTCMALVKDRLHEFNVRIQQYQTELDIYKYRLQGNRETIYQTIETFIQQYLETLRKKIEHKIILVQYDYNDRVLELEFLQQNPSEYCIKLYKQLYDARYKKDITREEVQLVEQRISYYNINSSQSHRQISHPTFFSTILNQDVQQQIYDQLTSVVEQAKVDMLNLYVKTAEMQMKTYDKQYNKELDKMFIERKQQSLAVEQQLTTVMLNLLEKRADNRQERIRCVNQFKIHCLHSNSNH
ncbi:unnamed protein product [Rotaria sp. Silwood2]